ncbi:hypothetical protein HGP28_10670 [Vibrio sp. SM6]|uniref:Uncharacterized protein n=1 Tax=Vibrio agarilyticus TaxID=2726741 RepID=A0A7X8TR50_9VIBR|nr:hypothetical protein [Vibrio agarilyticus]NLS13355.1 hypothetical protein [Vibrio agarilyticus]
MANKYPNPVRGRVHCPVCNTSSTVHVVGEGRLIAEGEPIKNGRNLGLYYYKCDECGNSAISRRVDEFVRQNMVVEGEPLPALQTNAPTEPLTANPADLEPEPTDAPAEVAPPVVAEMEGPTVPQAPAKPDKHWLKALLAALAVAALLLYAVRQLQPKAATEPTDNQGMLSNG